MYRPRAGSRIEMILSVPGEVWGKRSAEVQSQGRVVRVTPPMTVDQLPGLAATIERYRLAPKDSMMRVAVHKA
jgi:hypothetical protein